MIEGIPDGWKPVRFDRANDGDAYLGGNGEILRHLSPRPTLGKRLIVRKIKKPKKQKQYRPFANAAEYFANRREGSAVDGKNNTIAPGFFAVVSANQPYCWVAFGTKIVRFDWRSSINGYLS